MKINYFLAIALALFCYKNSSAMNREDLETRKRVMRESLDQINSEIRRNPMTRQEQPSQVLLQNKAKAKIIAETTANTDPQMARRARDLVQRINKKLMNQPMEME